MKAGETAQERLVMKYMRTGRLHHALLENRLSSTGVYRSQHRILMCISKNPDISQKDLAKMNEVSTATIAVSLKKLEKGGYISRLMDEQDNRFNQLRITEKGRMVVEKSCQIFSEVETAMFEGFSEEDYVKMGELLDRIYENLKQCNEN